MKAIKISELIKILEAFKETNGDLPVVTWERDGCAAQELTVVSEVDLYEVVRCGFERYPYLVPVDKSWTESEDHRVISKFRSAFLEWK